jgi:hypothetical protein
MKLNRYWIVLAAANILLLALTAMVNDGLAGWSVSLFLAGPCIVWPALRLGPGYLFMCLAIAGLAGDAPLPTPPGFLMTLFIGGACLIQANRPRLGRLRRSQQIGLAWICNGLLFAVFTGWALLHNGSHHAAFFERAAVDFGLSQIIVLPVTSWFFDFQESVLRLAGLTATPLRAEEAFLSRKWRRTSA